MLKYLPAYLTTLIIMLVVDIIWLSVLAKPIYQQGIGHLMASQANLYYASLFYLIYVFGLVKLAVAPYTLIKGIKNSFITGAGVGFFVYASYDLTNLALLKDWPLSLSLLDITWGTFISGASAAAGKWVFDRDLKHSPTSQNSARLQSQVSSQALSQDSTQDSIKAQSRA